jgi:predicted nucleotidyltransferase
VTTSETAATLLRRRQEAGFSQRELAALSGVPQPNIAAYERGRRVPASETLQRLDRALSTPTLARVRRLRGSIVEAAERRSLSDVRVFGSVAHDQAESGSDLDILVHPSPEASIFDLAGFMAEVEELLGVPVDVISDRGTGPTMDGIRADAVPL